MVSLFPTYDAFLGRSQDNGHAYLPTAVESLKANGIYCRSYKIIAQTVDFR